MTKTIKGITVEIGGNTTKLGKALADVNSKSKDLQKELKGVNTLLKMDPSNTVLLQQKQDLLNTSIANTKEKLNTLKQAQQQVQEQFDKGKITEEQFRDFQREIVATEQRLDSLTDQMREFGSVGAQKIAATGEKLKTVGSNIESAGRKLTGVSTVATGALAGIGKVAVDFESAWAGVTKTVEGTEEQLQTLRQGILDMSQETASSAGEIAAVAESAGQLGIETDHILEFTKTMVMLGDTTNLSATEASSALAKFANVTSLSADDYKKLGSTIVDLGNNFATTESDIVAMATRLASTGEITGLSQSQILALSTALSSAGIEAEAGGSAMAKLLKQLYGVNAGFDTAQKVVNSTGFSLRDLQLMQSNNSKGFKELADSLGLTQTELNGYMKNVDQMNKYASTAGVSVEEFKKAYSEDALGALSLFIGGLNETERNGKNAVEILNEMGITEVRLSNAVLAMASSGDLMSNAIRTANSAWGENTALTTEAEKRYATTASQLTQLKNTITELGVKLGEILLPIVQGIIDKLSGVINWLTSLNPTTQKIILVITGVVASLAPLLILIGKLVSSVGTIMTLAPKIVTMFKGIGTAFKALGGIIAANPIGVVIVALTALVAGLIYAYNHSEKFREIVNTAFAKVKEVVGVVVGALVTFFTETIPNAFGVVIDWFKSIPEKIQSGISNLVTIVQNVFTNVRDTIFSVAENIYSSLPTGFQLVVQNVQRIIENLVSIFQNCFNIIKTVVQTTISVVKAIFSGDFSSIPGIVSKALTSIKTYVTKILNSVITIVINWIASIINSFRGLGESLVQVIKNIGTKISEWWSQFKTSFIEWVKNLIASVIDFFAQLPGKIYDAIVGAIERVRTWGSKMLDTAKTAISNLITNVVNLATSLPGKIYNAIKEAITKVKTWGSSLVTTAKSAISDMISNVITTASTLPGQFVTIGTNIIEGIKSGITGAVSGLYEGIKNALSGLVDKAKEALGINSPSKVFANTVGIAIPEGIAKGINDNTYIADDAIEDMTDDLVNQANSLNSATIERKLATTFKVGAVETANDNNALLGKLDGIYERLSHLQIVLDTGTLVGETIDKIDAELAIKQLLNARGV